MSFPQNLAPMKAPVVVGKEAGYSALRAVELPELDTLLAAAAGKPLINLGARGNLLYASWGDDATGLSSEARQVRDAYIAQETKAARLNRWMTRYRADLQASNNTAAVEALKKLLDTLGLRNTPLLPAAQQMLVTNSKHCLKSETVDGKLSVYIADASTCSGADNELWMADLRGAIHSAANPAMCLSGNGGNNAAVTLNKCDRTLDAQMFDLSALPKIGRNGSCLDLSGGFLTAGRGKLITYSCSGGANQRWTGLSANDNALLALLSPNNLVVLRGLNIQ